MSGEKNEGEFFNRFKRIYPIPEGVKQLDVYAMLIEAKKECPIEFWWNRVTEERENGNSTFEREIMPNASLLKNRANASINQEKFFDWFKKWFGAP
jgi:hypothetical protein